MHCGEVNRLAHQQSYNHNNYHLPSILIFCIIYYTGNRNKSSVRISTFRKSRFMTFVQLVVDNTLWIIKGTHFARYMFANTRPCCSTTMPDLFLYRQSSMLLVAVYEMASYRARLCAIERGSLGLENCPLASIDTLPLQSMFTK